MDYNYGDRMSADERIGEYRGVSGAEKLSMVVLVGLIILSGFLN